MIASLRGVVQSIGENELVVEVGGVGLRIAVPQSVFDSDPEVGKSIFLHTYLVVREDRLALYGFANSEEQSIFELLLGVSGVGPRLALATLSHLSTEILRSAVIGNQPETLATVPGVGRKTGEKIILELKDRIEAPLEIIGITSDVDSEVIGVLTALGYSMVEAQSALRSIPNDSPEDVESRVRLALLFFASP